MLGRSNESKENRKGGLASKTGIDRISCAWRDAVGPGYAVGVTEKVVGLVFPLGSGDYCA